MTPAADLNGLVCFAERRNPVSARVPSHFKRSLAALTKRGKPLLLAGRATDQADTRRHLTAEARFLSRGRECRICGKQSGTRENSSPIIPLSRNSTNTTHSYFIHLPQTLNRR